MNIDLPKLATRACFSDKNIMISDEEEKKGAQSATCLQVRRKIKKKQLSLPLTHLLVGLNETYDMSKEYEMKEVLGFGTYSQVKLVKNLASGQEVAVKIVSGSTSSEMLKNERDILKLLDHDCFPKVTDFKEDKLWKKAYLFMEYIKGDTLDAYLDKNPNLDECTVKDLLCQLSRMIQHLHENQI